MKPHRTASRSRQLGLSFIGVIFVGLVAVATFAIGGQSVPVFLEARAIQKGINKAAREGKTVVEIQTIFDRAAAIDDITTIGGKDLDVGKRGDKVVIRANFSREIALAGPAYLVYRFELQSE
ncbi:MAG: DUF4845 domain-containing protein [Giesbergeria sp.]